jgi:glycosyltransferase involved in cell wall biosynthesis
MISVIIPVYNAEKYLKKCLKSVIEQTYKEFEVILINDGSTDNSAVIAKYFEQKDKRIRVIEQENSGPAQARNRGIEAAVGEYIAFIDSDDWVSPEMLMELYNAAERETADLVICGFEYFSKGKTRRVSQNIEPGVYIGENIEKLAYDLIATYEKKRLRPFSVVRMVRREILFKEHIRFDNKLKRSEDYLFWVQVHFKVKCINVITDKILYTYNQRDSSISHNYVKDYGEDVLYIEKCMRNKLGKKDRELDKRIKWFLIYRVQIVIANEAMSDKKWKEKKKEISDFVNIPEVKDAINSVSLKEGKKLIGNYYFFLRFKMSEIYLLLLCQKRRR